MSVQVYLPISPGTAVKTTQPNMEKRREWTEEGWAKKKWGIKGEVVTYHDSHSLRYDVRHEDGTEGCYDPSELVVVLQPDEFAVFWGYGRKNGKVVERWMLGQKVITAFNMQLDNVTITVNAGGFLCIEPIERRNCIGGYQAAPEFWRRTSELKLEPGT